MRNYRHPFLHNALSDAANGGVPPPLKKWMQSFVSQLDAEYQSRAADNDPSNDIPNPAGYRFYFDGEGPIASGTANDMYILSRLAADDAVPGSPVYHWWSTKPVPGFGTQTLKDLYDAERAARASTGLSAWPADINDPVTGITTGVTGGIQSTGAYPATNIPFSDWWSRICAQARIQVFQNVYGVIHDKWPNAKCGNYEDATADGVLDETSWFEDLNVAHNGTRLWGAPNGVWPEATANFGHFDNARARQMPRNIPGRSPTVRNFLWSLTDQRRGFRRVDNSISNADAGHEPNAPDVDSPNMYPLESSTLDGWGTSPEHQTGFRQRNLYVNPANCYPARSDDAAGAASEEYSEVLFDRMAAESVINSYPDPSLTLGHVDRLVPWLWEHVLESTDPWQYYLDERKYRAKLMMLRGKKVKELLWFTGNNDNARAEPPGIPREILCTACSRRRLSTHAGSSPRR